MKLSIGTNRTTVSLQVDSISSLMRWACPFVIGLIVTSVIVHKLGAERFGILTMTSSMISLVGFIGVGFNDATIKFLSQVRSLGNQVACTRIIQSNLFLFVIACGVVALLAIGLSPWLAGSIIRPSPELYAATQWVVIIIGITFGLSLVAGSFSATVAAAERYDLLAVLVIILSIVLGVGQIVIVLLFPDIVVLSLWYFISVILNLIGVVFLFRMIFPAIPIAPRPFRDAITQLSGFSAYRVLEAVFGPAYIQFDRVLIGILANVSNLMYCSIPATVSQMIGHGMSNLTMPLVPTTSVLQTHNKWSQLRELYLKTTRLVAWLTLAALVILVFLANPLLRVWLGESFASRSSFLLQWLTVGVGIGALGSLGTNVLFGLGIAKVNAAIRFVQALVSLGGIALFVPAYGIIAAGWGLVIGQAVTLCFLIIYTEHMLGLRIGTTLVYGLLRPLGVGLVLGVVAAMLAPFAASLVLIAGTASVLGILSVILAILFQVLDSGQLTRLLRIGGGLIRGEH